MSYHCSMCASRPASNLTILRGVGWRPECLASRAARQLAGKPEILPPEGAEGGVHGLRVIDTPRHPGISPPGKTKPPRPRRLTVVRGAKD